jgi:hypothetical protein
MGWLAEDLSKMMVNMGKSDMILDNCSLWQEGQDIDEKALQMEETRWQTI